MTSTLSIVLDAMVDVRVSGIDRETLHEPLSQQLEGMTKHQNPRLAQAASYAYQALRGVPDNEGPFETFQRQSWNVIQILAKTAGAVSSMDPTKALDATSNAMEFLSFFKTVVDALQDLYESSHDLQQLVRNMAGLSSQKYWYWALRYSNFFGAACMRSLSRPGTPAMGTRRSGSLLSSAASYLKRRHPLVSVPGFR